jgi:hypothetical protein
MRRPAWRRGCRRRTAEVALVDWISVVSPACGSRRRGDRHGDRRPMAPAGGLHRRHDRVVPVLNIVSGSLSFPMLMGCEEPRRRHASGREGTHSHRRLRAVAVASSPLTSRSVSLPPGQRTLCLQRSTTRVTAHIAVSRGLKPGVPTNLNGAIDGALSLRRMSREATLGRPALAARRTLGSDLRPSGARARERDGRARALPLRRCRAWRVLISWPGKPRRERGPD